LALFATLVAACAFATTAEPAAAGGTTDLNANLSGAASGSVAAQYFETGASVIPATGNFTIEAWVKIDSATQEMVFLHTDGTEYARWPKP
jgi:heme-binding NEAT domain protein